MEKTKKKPPKKMPFSVVCDSTNNTPEDIAEGRLTVTVTLPIGWLFPVLLRERA
jgi:hypothetical protein